MFNILFQQMRKQLAQIDTWFAKARAHADAKKYDPNLLTQFRLAPDQFALARQVQIACDTAKLGASRLTGKDAPSFDDSETTLDQLVERIAKTRAYLEAISEADL